MKRTLDDCYNERTTKTPRTEPNYQTMINDSTASIVGLLITRASAFENLNKFNDAIRDAHLVITQAPTQPQGYLLAGRLYSCQGRERLAYRILQKGLESNPDHGELQTMLTIAKERLERRIDFCSFLPAEVISAIWLYTGQNYIVEPMLVSKLWRTSIIQSTEPWQYIQSTEANMALANIMPTVGAKAQKLELAFNRHSCDYLPHGPCNMYLKCMIHGAFSNLKALHLNARMDANLLAAGLEQVKPTLMKLEVAYDMLLNEEARQENTILPLMRIMDICTNLTELKYVTHGSFGLPVRTKVEEPKSCALIRLDIFQHLVIDDEDYLSPEQLHSITVRCPKLRVITMRHFDFSYLDVLEGDCLLEHMYFINHDTDMPDNILLDYQQSGLRTLGIISNPFDLRDLWPFLNKHSETLQVLSFFLDRQHDFSGGRVLLPNVRELMMLQHAGIGGVNDREVASLVECCPSLETFSMLGGTLHETCLIALRESPKLQSLSLQATRIGGNSLRPLLKNPASMQLRHFRAYCLLVKELCLDSLTDIKTLEKIRLNCYVHGLDDPQRTKREYWEPFLEKLKSQDNQLKVVELDAIEFVDDQDMEALGGSKNLKQVVLQRLSNITDQGLRALVDFSPPTLKCVQVFDCMQITALAQEHARNMLWERNGHFNSSSLKPCTHK
ncbi:hypothetical protein BJV82DRAFT_296885 [Fennellomyces sp. T-0311]|nr:hypothetical protein BJV82DRAFT_296885 [Fennellomyces sp. T-0311]